MKIKSKSEIGNEIRLLYGIIEAVSLYDEMSPKEKQEHGSTAVNALIDSIYANRYIDGIIIDKTGIGKERFGDYRVKLAELIFYLNLELHDFQSDNNLEFGLALMECEKIKEKHFKSIVKEIYPLLYNK